MSAGVRHFVEGPCCGPQFVGVPGQGEVGFGGGLVGRAARSVVEQGALFEGPDDGPHPFLEGLVPAFGGGVRFGCRAVFGGAARAVAEQGSCFGGGHGP
jgi:hypothetical protein